MRYSIWLIIIVTACVSSSQAMIVPRHGGGVPQAYFDLKERDANALRMTRAWIQKCERIRASRDAVVGSGLHRSGAPLPASYQVSGALSFPVLLGAFVNQSPSYASDILCEELFTGPWPTGTLADYFDEVSYGALSVGGVVTDWVTTFQQDFHYEGASNGLLPNDAKTGEFIKELLDANDGAVDFGAFDNDGPDGVPNSGDDDGYVDFVVFVHSESGGECEEFSPNMWSHSWVYRGWPISGGSPYTTDDPSANGGNIVIDDYVIQSGESCEGGIIEIGGYCHALGHALGLPDLFDPEGGSSGAGHWDLMASGYWNTPESPAHLSAWCRQELGWVVPTVVTWQGAVQTIPQIETNPVCFAFPFTDERFVRTSECAIAGNFSLRCGLDDGVAAVRGWPGGSGYGNGWHEVIERQFDFDGAVPVTFSYDFSHELEPTADSAMVFITINGGKTLITSYTGDGSGTETLDLTPYVSPATPPAQYTLSYCVTSDTAWSDEDGKHVTTCGALNIDNISVTGGGESYTTDFESSSDGWYQNASENPATEYWLVENRQPVGFDANLHGSGLLIWHVDDEVIRSALGNTGGVGNNAVRGLVLEEADGLFHLLQDPETTGNPGDAGDPYPGSMNNTVFGENSNPGSESNSGGPTIIEISGISPSSASMSAYLISGDPGPTVSSVTPDVVNNDLTTVDLCLDGSGIRPGATFRFTRSGEADVVPTGVYWLDSETLRGDFNVYSKKGGPWDVIVENPDGREVSLDNALTIVQIVAAQLVSAMIGVQDGAVELVFEIYARSGDESLSVSRAVALVGPWVRLGTAPEEMRDGVFRFVDDTVEPGNTYFYRLDVSTDGRRRELYRGSAFVPAVSFVLRQNIPNPFNPFTTISFDLPEPEVVSLDVFDVSGAFIATITTGALPAGRHQRVWDGRDSRGTRVGSGVYLYRLQAGKRVQTRKMLLLE